MSELSNKIDATKKALASMQGSVVEPLTEAKSYSGTLNRMVNRMNNKTAAAQGETRFKTGDHVHASTGVHSFDVDHGVVTHHTKSTAHVGWDNGSTTIHKQFDGHLNLPGHHTYNPLPIPNAKIIRHNEHHSEAGTRRMSNDEHKALVDSNKASLEKYNAHNARHKDVLGRLGAMQPQSLTADHLDRLEKVLHDAKGTQ